MDTRWLEDFLALVETRNFSRSAECRFTTQPAFSRRIRSLEEWIGAPLFDRGTQPISLTPAGESFRPVAEHVLRRLSQGQEEAQRELRAASNTVRFAATHSLSLNFFPGWLRQLELRSHFFNTRLDTAHFGDSVKTLTRGDCHFLISYTHPRLPMGLHEDSFVAKVVLRDRLVPVTLPDASGKPLDRLPGTREEPVHYLAYSETSAMGILVEEFLAGLDQPVFFDRVFVSQMTAILKAMSFAGRGMAWLPESHLVHELERGELALAGSQEWFIPSDVRLLRSREPLSPAAEDFWALLEGPEDTDWG